MKRLIALSVLAAATFAGCVDEQKEMDKYRRVLGGSGQPATLPAVLTLQQALATANARNEQLAISGEDYLQSLIDEDRAVAAFLPMISLQPSYFMQQKVTLGPPGGPINISQFAPPHTFDVPINYHQNLFNGFRDVAALRQAAADIQQRKALLLDLQQTILVEVAQVYYEILRAERLVEVLKNSVQVQDNRVADLQRQVDVGVARRVDLAQAQAQAASTRALWINAGANVVKGRATLAFLLSVPRVDAALADQFEVPPVEGREPLEAMAQANRQNLVAAIAGVSAAEQVFRRAVGQYLPSVSVNLNYFLHRESFPSDIEWNALFSANVPIFSAGLIHADVRTALSHLRQAKYDESLVRNQIVENVRVAHENLTSDARVLEQLRLQVKAADEAHRQAQEEYKAGVGTNLQALVAQDQLLNSQVRLTSQEFSYKVDYLALLRTVGRLEVNDPAGPKLLPTTRPTASQPAVAAAARS